MVIKPKRDADNKWYVYLDWNEWIEEQAKASPNGPNLTVSISAVSWSIPAVLTQEAETPSDDINGITYLVGSGGTNANSYPITCTITYGATELTATDLTQDQSFTLKLEDQ